MEVGSFGDLDMSQVYPKTLFGPMVYSWWNCPLTTIYFPFTEIIFCVQKVNIGKENN